MKQAIFISALFTMFGCHPGWWQKDSDQYKTLPDIELLALDSTTHLRVQELAAGKPLILFYFSPDCEHCQAETSYLLKNISQLSDVNLVFASDASQKALSAFRDQYELPKYRNIAIGQDFRYTVFNTFRAQAYPDIVIYDKAKSLAKLYVGEVSIDMIIHSLNR